MTIASTLNKIQYTGNGTTVAFGFPYQFFALTDLVITLLNTTTGAVVAPSPTLNGTGTYDYTVTGTQDSASGEYLSGGTVTFNTAPPANYTVTILRSVPLTQQTSFTNNAPLPAKSIEAALDRVTMEAQQLTEIQGRVITGPVTDVGINMVLPPAAERALQIAGFDAEGNVTTFPAGTQASTTNRFVTSGSAGSYVAYSVDNSFSPPKIEQYFSAINFNSGSVNQGNGGVTVTITVPLPINFPNAFLGLALTVGFSAAPGIPAGYYYDELTNLGEFTLVLYGMSPNTNIGVSGIAVGN